MALSKGRLIPDMPFSEYQMIDGLNATLLKQLHRSPAHMKAYLSEIREPTEALLFGSAFHAALLESERFRDFMRVQPKFDRRTTVGKEAAADFEASLQPGDIVVNEEWMESITGMIGALQAHPLARPLLETGVRESVLVWDDPETGVTSKARFDFISHQGIPIDVKTTRDARPSAATRAIYSEDLLYFVQLGHYAAGAEATKVCDSDSFNFLFIEKEAPYGLCVKVVDGADLEAAVHHRNNLVKQYQRCKEVNIWPCYDPAPTRADASDWFIEKYGKEI